MRGSPGSQPRVPTQPQGEKQYMSNRLALPFSRNDLARLPGNSGALTGTPVWRTRAGMSGGCPASLLAFAAAEADVEREETPVDQLSFRRLRTAADIARIRHLREEIQLPVSAVADPDFQTREKKETSRGLWVPLSVVASSSGRSGSSRWA